MVDLANINIANLELYRSKLMVNFGDYERIHAMLEYNIRETMNLQARVNAKENIEHRNTSLKGIKKYIYLYYIYVHPIMLKIMAVLTALLSLALLYAEFSNFINLDFSFFSWIFTSDLGYFPTYFLMILPLSYMLT